MFYILFYLINVIIYIIVIINIMSKKISKSQSKFKNKSNFDNSESTTNYTDLIDLLSVSPSANDPKAVTWQDQITDYGILVLKYLFLVVILTLNFLGLSVSLNCNADEEMFKRILSAIFAFFFGFVYLLINYYTYYHKEKFAK